MESINPTLKIILFLNWGLKNGDSFKKSLENYTGFAESKDVFAQRLNKHLKKREHSVSEQQPRFKSIHQQAVFDLIHLGLSGVPVQKLLNELELEVVQATEAEIEAHLKSAPLKMMLPTLLIVFPAFLLLVFHIFNQFISEAL